ncbi:hypothetical protein THAOC_28949, partial [Thalassiosira oceanica]
MSPFTSQAVATRPLRLDESDSSGRLSPANLSADRSFAAKNIPCPAPSVEVKNEEYRDGISEELGESPRLCVCASSSTLTRIIGNMKSGYHLDIPDDALRKFSNDNSGRNKTRETNKRRGTFSKDYERPQLDFFNDHCDHVVSKYHLDQIHTKGKVKKIDPSNDRFVAVQVEKVDGGVEWY